MLGVTHVREFLFQSALLHVLFRKPKKNKLTKKSQDLCDLCGCFVWSLQPNRFSFSVFFATKLCCTKFDLKLTHSAFFLLRFLGNQTGVEESEEAGANLD